MQRLLRGLVVFVAVAAGLLVFSTIHSSVPTVHAAELSVTASAVSQTVHILNDCDRDGCRNRRPPPPPPPRHDDDNDGGGCWWCVRNSGGGYVPNYNNGCIAWYCPGWGANYLPYPQVQQTCYRFIGYNLYGQPVYQTYTAYSC